MHTKIYDLRIEVPVFLEKEKEDELRVRIEEYMFRGCYGFVMRSNLETEKEAALQEIADKFDIHMFQDDFCFK